MKIVRVEVYAFFSTGKPSAVFGSFIEAADYVAQNSTDQVVFLLDDGRKIIFHDTDASNGKNTVDIVEKEKINDDQSGTSMHDR